RSPSPWPSCRPTPCAAASRDSPRPHSSPSTRHSGLTGAFVRNITARAREGKGSCDRLQPTVKTPQSLLMPQITTRKWRYPMAIQSDKVAPVDRTASDHLRALADQLEKVGLCVRLTHPIGRPPTLNVLSPDQPDLEERVVIDQCENGTWW